MLRFACGFRKERDDLLIWGDISDLDHQRGYPGSLVWRYVKKGKALRWTLIRPITSSTMKARQPGAKPLPARTRRWQVEHLVQLQVPVLDTWVEPLFTLTYFDMTCYTLSVREGQFQGGKRPWH